jgi:hypothetical protein
MRKLLREWRAKWKIRRLFGGSMAALWFEYTDLKMHRDELRDELRMAHAEIGRLTNWRGCLLEHMAEPIRIWVWQKGESFWSKSGWSTTAPKGDLYLVRECVDAASYDALRAEVERLRGELQEWVAHYEDGLVTGGAGLYARTRDALKEQSDEEGTAYSRVMGAVLEQSDE